MLMPWHLKSGAAAAAAAAHLKLTAGAAAGQIQPHQSQPASHAAMLSCSIVAGAAADQDFQAGRLQPAGRYARLSDPCPGVGPPQYVQQMKYLSEYAAAAVGAAVA